MGRNVSISISAKENFSQAVTTMRTANSSFNKDLTGTMQKLDELNRNKINLKVDTDKAKSALKDAEKQFAATGSAADKMNMELASADYDNAKRNLDLVSKNARQAERDIISMTDAVSKADNRAGGGVSSGTLNTIAKAGLTKMIGDSVSNIAGAAVNSAFGSDAGSVFGSALSGAAAGAALGSLSGNPVGTAVGAVVGGVTGIVNGAVQVFQSQDENFKSVYQDSFNKVKQDQSDTLNNGSTIAGKREQDQISFSTILGGDGKAKDFLSSIRDFGNKTPFEYDQLTELSKTMLNYGYKQSEIIPELTKVGDTGSATGLNAEDMNYVITALGRMKSTGKTTMEYLNMLLERHIPALDYLAEASGKTKGQIVDMVSKGLIPGEDAAKAISDYMGKANKNSMELQSHSYEGMQSTLEDAQSNLDAAMGLGYNDERKLGMENEINSMSGATGKQLEEANTMIGKFQADLVNTQNQLLNDAKTSIVSGTVTGNFSDDNKKRLQQLADDYKEAKALSAQGDKEAGIKAAQDMAEAQVIAVNEYKASEGYQLQLQSDLDLAANIRNDTELNTSYYSTGYKMGQSFSQGLAAAAIANKLALGPSNLITTYLGENTEGPKTGESTPGGYLAQQATGHATGMFRVPYNNFHALLHEGETINTAVEARSGKNTPSIQVTINGLTVREESDVDKVASKLFEKIQKASLVS